MAAGFSVGDRVKIISGYNRGAIGTIFGQFGEILTRDVKSPRMGPGAFIRLWPVKLDISEKTEIFVEESLEKTIS